MSHGLLKCVSLLDQVPEEILGEIFLRCCASITDRSPTSSLSPPLSLSHVCRLWRRVAFSTPRLWTYASLGAPRHSLVSTIEMLKIWVTNAKRCPSVIDVDLRTFALYKKPDDVLPFVKRLTRLVEELKPSLEAAHVPLTVTITPQKFPYADERFDWTPDALPAEERPYDSVSLHVATPPCMLYGMTCHTTFGPHLVHLDLRDFEENMALSLDAATDILRAYPRLRHLALRLGEALHAEDENGPDREVHVMRDLEELCLSWDYGALPGLFLNSLRASILAHLELDGPEESDSPVWEEILDTLRSTRPHLRALDLYRLDCGGTHLAHALALCPGLERLWISDSTIDVTSIRESLYPRADASLSEADISGAAWHTLSSSLRTLGIVRCEMLGMSSLFATLMLSRQVWTDTRLEGLYIADCNLSVRGGTGYTAVENPGALHLLRSRWEAGEYGDLGARVHVGDGSEPGDSTGSRPNWVRRLFFSFRP